MTSNSTKYPNCRQRHQQAAAYGKHLQKMHSDILSLQAIVEQTLRVPTAFVRGENPNQTNISITNRPLGDLSDSDYESDPSPEIIDCNSYSASDTTDDDIRYDSDGEDIFQPPAQGCPLSQQTIPGAGRILGDVAGYAELNQAMMDDPWSLSSPETHFNVASWSA